MGIHRLPQLEMFWDSDEFIGVEGFKKTIPKQRFKTLGKYLHLVDPGDEDANDVLCKVRSLVTLLEDKFADAYIPGKNVSVDEGLVKFNGRLSFKQYMPMKPDKFGIKVWMLADADNYYVPRFQVYLDLESRDTYACGTVRINRRDFPADLKRAKLVRGEIRTRQCGNLVATMWRDKRVVSLLSTNTPPEAEIHAEQQIVRGRRKQVVPADSMKKPDVVAVYNDGMNGVDVNDQYRSYYPASSVSRKWWKYLLWFFFNLSIVNSYILEKLAGHKKRSQLAFRRELARLLIAGYNGYKRPSSSGKRAIQTLTREENLGGHFLGKLQGRKKACAMCSKAGRKRSEGRTFETSFGCEQCGVPLCRQMRGEKSCFSQWHGGD
ncbi:piggyBac transposable element-derived protein 4-like [Acropora muricata]|uniref:piggyBac transposable element-derived protein 4-like n=1 Tax=Acropora muricata TaxID=159855 RepID=UPI0034E494B2